MNKLLLFDIDGTLISGRGIPKKVALNVFRKHFPQFEKGEDVRFNGMTDPLIVKELLAANNYHIEMDNPIIEQILDEFIDELKLHANPNTPPTILPGVMELLESCSQMDDVYIGIVTGNLEKGALIKLSAVNIDHYFPVGAYGSDHWDRNQLPPIAVKRSEEYFNITFLDENIWIIGDSIKDVECARVNKLKCLAVETGKISQESLAKAGADKVLKDLTDTQYILDIINS